MRSMTGLAKQIALPHEFAPERFPSFPALERTAVMGFNAPVSLALPAETPVKVMLSRQAAYPAWAEIPNTKSSFYAVGYAFTDSEPSWTAGTGGGSNTLGIAGNVWDWAVAARGASASQLGFGTAVTNFTYPILAVDSGTGTLPFVWKPKNSVLSIVTGFVPTGSAVPMNTNNEVHVSYDMWLSPGQIETHEATVSVLADKTSGLAALSESQGWFRPRSATIKVPVGCTYPQGEYVAYLIVTPAACTLTTSASTLGSITLAAGTDSVDFLPMMQPYEFANSQLPWYSTRTTAAALLGTNVSQVLVKGGTVLAGRVAPQIIDPFNVTADYITNLHPAEKAYLPLETGVYTYAPPSTDMVDFWDYTLATGSKNTNLSKIVSAAPLYRLDNTSLVNIMFITASGIIEKLACNIDWHIEFRTTSTLFQIGLSAVTLEAFHQAQLALVTAGFFFENPEHKTVLAKVISAVRKIAPSAIGMLNPLAGKAAQILLSDRPASKMHATSADKSGITVPAKKIKKVKAKKVKVKGGKK